MKNIDKAQTLLPLGYLFLVILGMGKESITYYQLGINITKYSSIMDILISPLATITSHPFILITIIAIIIFFYNLPQILIKNEDKKWVFSLFGIKKIKTELSEEERLEDYTMFSLQFLSFFLICVFLGYGLADGNFISKQIKNNQLKYDYNLNFNDEKSENAHIIGSNSVYYFYVTKGNQHIQIAPLSSIKNIELLKNKMLDK